MIIARGTTDTGKELLLFGLSRENIKRLLDGKPMHVRREAHGEGVPEGWEIGIFFGETEADCARVLRQAGLITDDTKICRMPNEPKS